MEIKNLAKIANSVKMSESLWKRVKMAEGTGGGGVEAQMGFKYRYHNS